MFTFETNLIKINAKYLQICYNIYMNTYENLNILKQAKRICLIGHIEPDPDSLASMITLKSFIQDFFHIDHIDLFAETEQLSANAKLIMENEVLNPITTTEYDTAILVDSPSIERMGKYSGYFNSACLKIVIDHHATNTFFGDVNIVETCSSTCEIIYSICKYFNYSISKSNQGKLYAGIIADTNNFTVGAIGERTFFVASKICQNINRDEIYSTFLANNSLKNMQMLALAIQNLTTYENNQIIISFISHEQAIKYNITHNDLFGIVNKLSTITNSKLVCFIEPKEVGYYVSMRAKKGYDVSLVAKNNGGGGHVGAAAFVSEKDLNEIISNILYQFTKQLKEIKINKTKLF